MANLREKPMFKPVFTITPAIASLLMEIEALKQEINALPITPHVLAGLRESARLATTKYSTYIEGNRLSLEQIDLVIHHGKQIPERTREEKEVLGYYSALEEVEKLATTKHNLTEKNIQNIHALVMGGGNKKIKPTPYRTVQNVIRDSTTGKIVYLPPEYHDVPILMSSLCEWLTQSKQDHMPHPLRAAIAHYQFATIHPYIDGNGRTARLLTTLILHKESYGLKGIYSLEEYYAKNLADYYQALDIGPSHNYYLGRADADITSWIEYFCAGMLESFKNVKRHALEAQFHGSQDTSTKMLDIDPRKRIALTLFTKKTIITSHDIEALFKLKPRTARALCKKWVDEGFLIIVNPSKKIRNYQLNPTINR